MSWSTFVELILKVLVGKLQDLGENPRSWVYIIFTKTRQLEWPKCSLCSIIHIATTVRML